MRTSGLEGDPELFRQALLEVPGVRTASLASGLPSGGAMTSSGEIGGVEVVTHRYLVDAHFLEATGVELKAGRFYDPARPTDGDESVVVNETLAELQGWADAVGQRVVHGATDDGTPRYAEVIGVVRDFHTGSLHERISPAYLDARASLHRYRQAVLVKVDAIEAATVERLTGVWDRYAPARPASMYFADDVVRGLYDAERRLLTVFMVFTVLAATIAALGLFGLAAHAAERRTKEIGIRKVLGASLAGLAGMLSSEFLVLTLAALAVGVPVAHWAVGRWLESFAYRIEPGVGYVGVTAALVLVLAIGSVAGTAVRAGLRDPVGALRAE